MERKGSAVEFDDLFKFLTQHVGVSTGTPNVRHTSSDREVQVNKVYLGTNSKGPHKGKKPKRFRFNGCWHRVAADWGILNHAFCNLLLQDNINTFYRVLNFEGDRQATRRHYFAFNKGGLRRPVAIADTGIFVDVNLSANNTVYLVEALNDYFGYKSRIEIEYVR